MKIILKDKQTLDDEEDRGNPVLGLELEVSEEILIQQTNILWKFFKFKDSNLVVLSRFVGNEANYFVLVKPEGLNFGNKQAWIDSGWGWLFEEDGYIKSIQQNQSLFNLIEDNQMVFVNIPSISSIVQAKNGRIVQWFSEEDYSNPYIFCIEFEDQIEFYQGGQILEHEIEFL